MLDQQKLNQLAAVSSPNSISFYLPTHRVDGIQEDKIRYKNSISEVKSVLAERDFSDQEINKIMKEAEAKLKEEKFWRHLSDALAVFIYDGNTSFHTLPIEVESFHFIGDQLYLLPLLPLVNNNHKFYTLALSQNQVRVFEGTDFTFAELEKNSDFPENLEEILRFYEEESTLQHHSGNGENAVFHGQGAGKDVKNVRLEEFLRRVDKGIETMSCDDDKTPLVLYSTPTLAGLYRKINTYPHLMEDFIEGNPENEDMLKIHEKSYELLMPRYAAMDQEELDNFESALANETATFDIQTIGPAAMAGQIKTLFLVRNQETWGKYNPVDHSVELHSSRKDDSQPLYNDLSLSVINQGGTVHLLDREDMPRPTSDVNAIFYYALTTA
ncbi:hypothetical protein [Lewinella sp. LCG006]|uniref:baeRF7 domain-containing protein n=1 Tax=Lewinella sp. LCG006 TaxID=3231911 RepID=UPI00345F558A